MSTMGPLCPEQLAQEETLDEVCVGPIADLMWVCKAATLLSEN